jgi:hypothetical protein
MFVLERDALYFHCLEHSSFHSYRSASALFFSTAFSFYFSHSFLFRTCLFFVARSVWTSGLCWFSSWELFQKGWLVLEKRKKFHAYSGTNGRLFRLWLRLLHVMLDVILIICLVAFVVAWLVSNDWECLMCLQKIHALFLSYRSIFLWYSPLMLYLGWLGACLHHFWIQPVTSSLYDHLVFDLWCHFMLWLIMFCRYPRLWSLLLS